MHKEIPSHRWFNLNDNAYQQFIKKPFKEYKILKYIQTPLFNQE